MVDKIGTVFDKHTIVIWFRWYLDLPILQEKWRADLEKGKVRALLSGVILSRLSGVELCVDFQNKRELYFGESFVQDQF